MFVYSSWTEKELEEGEWRTLALQRMAKVLHTHVIKFDFEDGKSVEKGQTGNDIITTMYTFTRTQFCRSRRPSC